MLDFFEKLLKIIPLGRLPGDLLVVRPHFRFFFPITTCLLLSSLISGIYGVVRLFRK